MQWINRRHPEKNATWKYKKYFRSQGTRQWIFSSVVTNKKRQSKVLDLFSASQLPIRRHIKIKAEANPYDPEYVDYFSKREYLKKKMHILDREFFEQSKQT